MKEFSKLEILNEYIFRYNGKRIPDRKFYDVWNKCMKKLDMSFHFHDCRKAAVKHLMHYYTGHADETIFDRVYHIHDKSDLMLDKWYASEKFNAERMEMIG